ncbi:hypothetical protein MKW94_022797 [Papaver nudicaule]|uniref:Ribosome biogenesis protein BMS1/TSR1 C-terminal domain-containing protein n=1 Tax=Papaver nudicaule TaxID=74823 RepID=A0AA41V8X2_PAPNU|nr:hypothetical protein [Papaver nudicaule]
MVVNRYLKHEIAKLATYISTMEFYPLSWRAARPYMLVDHFKDVTSQEAVQMDEECPRNIVFEGYLRGCHIEEGTKVHIAGFGDFPLASVTSLTDPFPLPPVDEVIPMGIEGFRAGTYVRFEFHDVPFEMVKNHDPCQPILVGRISLEEENVGYIQVRLERHSWHMKLLKTKDPIIVSVGWRRYQTRPVYALEDCHGSYRVLNYTPENIPCLAMFWGPLAPPGTGLAAVQSLADNKAAFRILAKASVLDFNQAAQIVKKCKRIGTPYKILKKTALIKDMFTSDLEIANFKNAIIQTTSGVHGKINKPAGKNHIRGLETKDGQPREGIAKCTFKRKIRKRDTIFMHVYEQVEVPRFFSPIMRGPEPPDRVWEGVVDTCGASDLPVAANIESFYKSHINPLEVKDLELHSRWSSVMQAEMLATSEEEILSVKRQKEDLKIACDERRREMEFLSRRRQTLEKLRAVHIIESQKKHRKTEKQSLISEKHLKLLKRLRKDVMKGFNEYEKGKKRTAR